MRWLLLVAEACWGKCLEDKILNDWGIDSIFLLPFCGLHKNSYLRVLCCNPIMCTGILCCYSATLTSWMRNLLYSNQSLYAISTKLPQFRLTGSPIYQRENDYRATTWTWTSPRYKGIRDLDSRWSGSACCELAWGTAPSTVCPSLSVWSWWAQLAGFQNDPRYIRTSVSPI